MIQSRNSALRHQSQADSPRKAVCGCVFPFFSSFTLPIFTLIFSHLQFTFEIEGRLGIVKTQSGGFQDARVLSSGPKRVQIQGKNVVATAFLCSTQDSMDKDDGTFRQRCTFEAGIKRSHYLQWTSGGLSEASPISAAFGVRIDHSGSESATIKRDLMESDKVETVYTGYSGHYRVCFPGDRTRALGEKKTTNQQSQGRIENKVRVTCSDIALPSAPYDLRLTLATEEMHDTQIQEPPTGWNQIRLKKRRTYTRRDNTFAWILDVTEVTTSHEQYTGKQKSVEYEIEFELNSTTTAKLLSETDDSKIQSHCSDLSKQLWWMIGQINPNSDVLNVEDFLREHPNQAAVRLALAQCSSIKQFLETKHWSSAISNTNAPSSTPNPSSYKVNFPGCMPVNFSRHHVDEIQQNDENAYFLSEKTDGVRHFMIFTGE